MQPALRKRQAVAAIVIVVIAASLAWAVHSASDRQPDHGHPSDAYVIFEPLEFEQLEGPMIPKPKSCEPGKPGHCPIVLDLAGEGLELTRPQDGVWFDLDADGTPEQVAWMRPGSDLALLALDFNDNGRIDDGGELFGSTSVMPADATEAHGWVVLRWYDEVAGGNGDGKLSTEDQIWNDLWLWRDRNHNGLSEAGELSALADSGVRALPLDYREVRTVDAHGNETRFRADVPRRPHHGAGERTPGVATEVILREHRVDPPLDG